MSKPEIINKQKTLLEFLLNLNEITNMGITI